MRNFFFYDRIDKRDRLSVMTGVYILEFGGEMIPVTQYIKDTIESKHPGGQDICINEPDFTGNSVASKINYFSSFGTPQPFYLTGLAIFTGILADLVVFVGHRVVDPCLCG